jgi:hypothetical protein
VADTTVDALGSLFRSEGVPTEVKLRFVVRPRPSNPRADPSRAVV